MAEMSASEKGKGGGRISISTWVCLRERQSGFYLRD